MADNNENPINLQEIVSDKKTIGGVNEPTPSQRIKSKLAAFTLLGVAFIFLLSSAAYIFIGNDPSKEVFDFCSKFLPAIVTMVLGAYFSTRNDD